MPPFRPLDGGGTLLLDSRQNVRGPGHCQVFRDGPPAAPRDYLVHPYYDADRHGKPFLHVRPLTRTAEGRPVAGEPINP